MAEILDFLKYKQYQEACGKPEASKNLSLEF
jgi:hypothetical protein